MCCATVVIVLLYIKRYSACCIYVDSELYVEVVWKSV